jgi:hypothetical protein
MLFSAASGGPRRASREGPTAMVSAAGAARPDHGAIARRLLIFCLSATLLQTSSGARPKGGGAEGPAHWTAELRRVPRPTYTYDDTGKHKSYSQHFVRNNVATSEYTILSYNFTHPDDWYIDLDAREYAVQNVTCSEHGKVNITTKTRKGMRKLLDAILSSPSGLLYGGAKRRCPSELAKGAMAPIHR